MEWGEPLRITGKTQYEQKKQNIDNLLFDASLETLHDVLE